MPTVLSLPQGYLVPMSPKRRQLDLIVSKAKKALVVKPMGRVRAVALREQKCEVRVTSPAPDGVTTSFKPSPLFYPPPAPKPESSTWPHPHHSCPHCCGVCHSPLTDCPARPQGVATRPKEEDGQTGSGPASRPGFLSETRSQRTVTVQGPFHHTSPAWPQSGLTFQSFQQAN